MSNTWSKWLTDLSVEQLNSLREAMDGSDTKITVVRAPTVDNLYTHAPPYVDVFNLIPLYQKLMFQENLLVRGPRAMVNRSPSSRWPP